MRVIPVPPLARHSVKPNQGVCRSPRDSRLGFFFFCFGHVNGTKLGPDGVIQRAVCINECTRIYLVSHLATISSTIGLGYGHGHGHGQGAGRQHYGHFITPTALRLFSPFAKGMQFSTLSTYLERIEIPEVKFTRERGWHEIPHTMNAPMSKYPSNPCHSP